MTAATPPREFIVVGLTADGKPFRPSDWAERLAGAMSCFGPDGVQPRRPGPFICYSPFCVPTLHQGVRSVRVSQALEAVEPMAWQFVMDFARDNGLRVIEEAAQPAEPVLPTSPTAAIPATAASAPTAPAAAKAEPSAAKPTHPPAASPSEPVASAQTDG